MPSIGKGTKKVNVNLAQIWAFGCDVVNSAPQKSLPQIINALFSLLS